jgi:hypothetical protein
LGGGSYGAGVSGQGNIIRYNYIHGFSNGCDGKGMAANGAGGQIIYGNLVEDLNATSNNVGIDLVANEVANEGNWKVFNNTVTDINGWALRISHNEKAGTEVYNNILDGDSGDFNVNGSTSDTLL